MAKTSEARSQKNAKGGTIRTRQASNKAIQAPGASKAAREVDGGVDSLRDVITISGLIAADVLNARLSPPVANAACNAMGKQLRAAEMGYRYGKKSKTLSMAAL